MSLISHNCENKISAYPMPRKESPTEYRARQARLDSRYPNRHVVLTLRNWDLYAIATDDSVVSLGTTAAFTDWSAEEVARSRVKHMLGIDRQWLRLVKRADVLVREYFTSDQL
jgi:hypothetical protein